MNYLATIDLFIGIIALYPIIKEIRKDIEERRKPKENSIRVRLIDDHYWINLLRNISFIIIATLITFISFVAVILSILTGHIIILIMYAVPGVSFFILLILYIKNTVQIIRFKTPPKKEEVLE